MRAIALAVAFLALAGCKSHPPRDYRSVNKNSVDFVLDTFHDGNRMRKKNLKLDLAFSQRAPQNEMIRKTSIDFAWESLWIEEGSGLSEILHAPEVEKVPWSKRLASMRFGFLDSGD